MSKQDTLLELRLLEEEIARSQAHLEMLKRKYPLPSAAAEKFGAVAATTTGTGAVAAAAVASTSEGEGSATYVGKGKGRAV